MENGIYIVISLKKCINYSKFGLFVKIMWEGFIFVIYIYGFKELKRWYMLNTYVGKFV